MSDATRLDQATPAADPAADRDRWLSAMADMESRHDMQMEAMRRRIASLEAGRRRGFSLTEEERVIVAAAAGWFFITVIAPVLASYVRRWTQQTQS